MAGGTAKYGQPLSKAIFRNQELSVDDNVSFKLVAICLMLIAALEGEGTHRLYVSLQSE